MTCVRCCGNLIKDPMWDLPRRVQEFFCMNCGERFWIEKQPDPDPEPLHPVN